MLEMEYHQELFDIFEKNNIYVDNGRYNHILALIKCEFVSILTHGKITDVKIANYDNLILESLTKIDKTNNHLKELKTLFFIKYCYLELNKEMCYLDLRGSPLSSQEILSIIKMKAFI
jgi:hypothetical protein